MNIPKSNITTIISALNNLLEYEFPLDVSSRLIEIRDKIANYKKYLDHEKEDIFSKYDIETIGPNKIRIADVKNIPMFQADMKNLSQGYANIDIIPVKVSKITLDNKSIPIYAMFPLYGIVEFE